MIKLPKLVGIFILHILLFIFFPSNIPEAALPSIFPSLSLSPLIEANAGEWKRDAIGWWWEGDDGNSPYKTWVLIDDKWYYFGEDGYMAENRWIDDYYVGPDGALVGKKGLSGDYLLFNCLIDRIAERGIESIVVSEDGLNVQIAGYYQKLYYDTARQLTLPEYRVENLSFSKNTVYVYRGGRGEEMSMTADKYWETVLTDRNLRIEFLLNAGLVSKAVYFKAEYGE